jgi:hypothetical protein
MKRFVIACASSLLIAAACGGSGETDTKGPGAGGSSGSGGSAGNGGSSGGKGGSSSSGGSSAGSSGANAGGSNTGGSSAGAPPDGPFPCGAETCGATQYCINPCCGGAPLPCFSAGDGGVCPEGSTPGCTFPGGQCSPPATCCQPGPCVPPPAYCADEVPIGCLLQGRSCLMLCA